SLLDGEIAINQKDKKIFYRDDLGVVQSADLILFSTIQNALNLKQDKITVIKLNTAFSSTSITRANVPTMSFNVTAGKRYKIELIGSYQSVATTTGGSIGFVLTSGVGTIIGYVTASISQSAVATDLTATIRSINATSTTAGSFITSTGVSVINSPHYLCANLIFDCTTSGVFQLQYGSEVAGSSSSINAGATLIVTPLN
ncbi:hypothetical protein, partial [Flavobacterium sp.]|uniref:hypothetical protein n=1 Tax=Flavobacterium sp. TaxID=239 RepID=UPI00374CCF59